MHRLIDCYKSNSENELIKWKVIRSMSAFTKSEKFLNKEYGLVENDKLRQEILRSKKLIRQKRCVYSKIELDE